MMLFDWTRSIRFFVFPNGLSEAFSFNAEPLHLTCKPPSVREGFGSLAVSSLQNQTHFLSLSLKSFLTSITIVKGYTKSTCYMFCVQIWRWSWKVKEPVSHKRSISSLTSESGRFCRRSSRNLQGLFKASLQRQHRWEYFTVWHLLYLEVSLSVISRVDFRTDADKLILNNQNRRGAKPTFK